MQSPEEKTLLRDCESTVIPAGDTINLPAGTKVSITHRLGGNFTVVCDYGMFRIEGANADALGEPIPEAAAAPATDQSHEGPPDEQLAWDHLRQVFDPEIPVNIVDLGLVYSMQVSEIEEGKYAVDVSMTLTAPGCGMGPAIADDARKRVLAVPGVHSANVELVWDPPWSQDMISEEGKMELGLI